MIIVGSYVAKNDCPIHITSTDIDVVYGEIQTNGKRCIGAWDRNGVALTIESVDKKYLPHYNIDLVRQTNDNKSLTQDITYYTDILESVEYELERKLLPKIREALEYYTGEKKTPRKIQWKVRADHHGVGIIYGTYSQESLDYLLEHDGFKDLRNVQFVQCVELNPGEILRGDKIVYEDYE